MRLQDYDKTQILRVNNDMPMVRGRFAMEHRALRIQARDAGLPEDERSPYATSHACARIGQPLQRDEFWRAYLDIAKFRKWRDLRRHAISRCRALRTGAINGHFSFPVIDSKTGRAMRWTLAC